MDLTRETVLVWIVCLAWLYCDVNGTVVYNVTAVQQDRLNWQLLSSHVSKIQRSVNANPNVFSKILLANIKARSKVGRTDDGVFLFQGDIKIPKESLSTILAPQGRKKRALLKDRNLLWMSPIYYQLSNSLGGKARKAILSAIAEWRQVLPCIRWINGNVATSQQGYLYFFKGDGCFSDVGRTGGDRKQEISIGEGCEGHGTAVHEIAHALGIYHEQSRPDRDNYVTIHWNNIIPKMRFNFEKESQSEVSSLGIKYDYDSVMHYGPYDFSRDGSKTITAKKKTNIKFGSKTRLSKSDRQQAQLLYKCKGPKTVKPPPPATPAPQPSPPPASGSGSGGGPNSSG